MVANWQELEFVQRIVIIGASGAGKSTFGRELSARTGIPVTHIDSLLLEPGHIRRPREEVIKKICEATSGCSWIVEGAHIGLLKQSKSRVDTCIWLDLPIHIRLPRAIIRNIRRHGKEAADLSPGCPFRFQISLQWQLWKNRKQYPKKARRFMKSLAPDVNGVVLSDKKEIQQFLVSLDNRTRYPVGA